MNIKIKLANNSLWAVVLSIALVVFVLFDASKNNRGNTDNLYINAENAFVIGDYSKSKELFEQIIADNPKDLLANIRISEILTKVRKYDLSIDYLNNLVKQHNIDENLIKQQLAENYYYKKDYIKAEELINATLITNKNNLFLIEMMLNINLLQGRYLDALTFISTFDESIFDDHLLFYKRIIQIYNNVLEKSSDTNFKDKTIQNLFLKIENNLEDYKLADKKVFGATNICFELLQYNYFELSKPFAEDIITYNNYMDYGYFYKGLSALSTDYPLLAEELFKQSFVVKDTNPNSALMLVLTNIVLDQSDQIDSSLEQLNKIITPDEKYKLIEILKYSNQYQKSTLGKKLFDKFPQYLSDDLTAVYFRVKFNAINGNFDNLLGDINRLFAESHYLNDKQKALLLSIKGYIIAKDTNVFAGKELIMQGIELDEYSHFCYYFLSKVNLLQNDNLSYDINYSKAKEIDLFQELKYE